MQSNSSKIDQLVSRLLDRTRSNAIKWETALESGKYQARFGDFVVQISGSVAPLTTPSINLSVKKTDGRVVEDVKTGIQNAFASLAQTPLPSTVNNLEMLYRIVSDNNREIDELIQLI